MMHMGRRFHTYSIGLLGRNTRGSEMRAQHVARMGEERNVNGKARRKETTWKTKA
jgi:hypothetical protein